MKRLISIVAALAIIGIAAAQTEDQVEFNIEVQGDAALKIVPPAGDTNVEIEYVLGEDGQWRTTEGLPFQFALRYFSNRTYEDEFYQENCEYDELAPGETQEDKVVCGEPFSREVLQLVPHYITVKAGQVGADDQLVAVPAFLDGALEMIVAVDSDGVDGEVSCAAAAFVNPLDYSYTAFDPYRLPNLHPDWDDVDLDDLPDWAKVDAAGPSDEQRALTEPFLGTAGQDVRGGLAAVARVPLPVGARVEAAGPSNERRPLPDPSPGTAGQDVRVAFDAVDVDLVGDSSDRTTGLRGAYCGTHSDGGATVYAEIDMSDDKLIPEGDFPVQLVFTLNEYSD